MSIFIYVNTTQNMRVSKMSIFIYANTALTCMYAKRSHFPHQYSVKTCVYVQRHHLHLHQYNVKAKGCTQILSSFTSVQRESIRLYNSIIFIYISTT